MGAGSLVRVCAVIHVISAQESCPVLRFRKPQMNTVYSVQSFKTFGIEIEISLQSPVYPKDDSINPNGPNSPKLSLLWNHENVMLRHTLLKLAGSETATMTKSSWLITFSAYDMEVTAGNHVLEAILALWNMPSECSAESLETAVIFRIAEAIMSIEHISSLAQGDLTPGDLKITYSVFGIDADMNLEKISIELLLNGILSNRTQFQHSCSFCTIQCHACCINNEINITLRIVHESENILSLDEGQLRCSGDTEGMSELHRRVPKFSNFRCTQGQQPFPSEWGIPNSDDPRTCLLENVCWIDQEFTFFQNPWADHLYPESLSIQSFASEGLTVLQPVEARLMTDSVHVFQQRLWAPVVQFQAIPRDVQWSAHAVHVLDSMSIGYNFGHFLLDSVLPVFIALDAFDLASSTEDTQLVLSYDCSHFADVFYHVHGAAQASKVALCQRHYDQWLADYFLNHPPLYLRAGATDGWRRGARGGASGGASKVHGPVCFHRLIVGHGAAFGPLNSRMPDIGAHVRRFRDRIAARIGLDGMLAAAQRGQSHRVLVTCKQSGWTGPLEWPTACGDVERELLGLSLTVTADHHGAGSVSFSSLQAPSQAQWHSDNGCEGSIGCSGDSDTVPVLLVCADPAGMPFYKQAEAAASASVLVTEHGTVSYLALFLRSGAVVVVFGSPPLKETHVLLLLTHVQVLLACPHITHACTYMHTRARGRTLLGAHMHSKQLSLPLSP